MVNSPVKISELPDLNLGGRDFVLLKEEKLLFVAESDMNIASRLDSYLTNVSKLIANISLVHFSLGKAGLSLCYCGSSCSIQNKHRPEDKDLELRKDVDQDLYQSDQRLALVC